MRPVTRHVVFGVLLGLALVGSSTPAGAQVQTAPEERFFRIDWKLESAAGGAAAIVGSLKNDYLYPIREVWVQAQVLDGAGQSTYETLAPVADVPPGGWGTFRVKLPATGARYVVTVHAFEFGRREGSGLPKTESP